MDRKLLSLLMLAAGLGLVFPDETNAQDGWRRFVPQGRLIQRLRDDLNDGRPLVNNPFADSTPAAASKRTAANTRPTPTTARKPTPATGSNSKVPGLSAKTNPSKNNEIGSGVHSQNSNRQVSAKSASGSAKKGPTTNNAKGFGMTIVEHNEQFFVGQVVPGGNAAKAGIRKNDVITAIGGAKMLTLDELDAIAKAMSGGDQVEFTMGRSGKKEKMLVQFGDLPAVDESKLTSAPARNPAGGSGSGTTSRSGSGLQSVLDLPSQSAPPARNLKIQSLQDFDLPPLNK